MSDKRVSINVKPDSLGEYFESCRRIQLVIDRLKIGPSHGVARALGINVNTMAWYVQRGRVPAITLRRFGTGKVSPRHGVPWDAIRLMIDTGRIKKDNKEKEEDG